MGRVARLSRLGARLTPQDQFGGAAFGAPQSFSQQNAGGFQVDNSTPDGKVR